MFTATFIDRDSEDCRVFVLHEDVNQIKELLRFLDNEVEGLIGYNCLYYDSQILEYLYKNPNATTVNIREYSDVIIDAKDRWPDVPEWGLRISHLDLYKIHHFDNKNRRTSLKWCEYSMDMPNIEDMPENLNGKLSLDSVLAYNFNDVISTKKLYEYTRKMIDLRKELSRMYNINFMNASNSRIGSELCLKLYCEATNKNKNDVKQLRTHHDNIIIKDLIFNYITFKTPTFQKVYNYFQSLIVKTTHEINYSIKLNGIEYVYGSGGIHASVNSKIFESNDDYIILDCDVKCGVVTH
jgi:hypothetical protein